MPNNRDSKCPLCGATLTPTEILDACGELVDPVLGVVETHCPHCQGRLEARPSAGQVDLGFLIGDKERFDVALAMPCAGLKVERPNGSPCIRLTAAGRVWEFRE
jgi:hypothetical protein